MMLEETLEKPSVSAWLMACRSMARLAARRTRRSCHGDFGFHCSVVKSIQNVAGIRVGASFQSPRALDFLGELTTDGVGHVGFPTLEHCEARRLLGDHAEHEPFHLGRLAPVALVRFQHQLHAGVRRRTCRARRRSGPF